MKFYFDNLTPGESNCNFLTYNPYDHSTFWSVSHGSIIKKVLSNMRVPIAEVSAWDEPGCYYIDLNGDPEWWCGCKRPPCPQRNVIYDLPEDILEMARKNKIRIVLAADKEGGSMTYFFDCFYSTTQAMINKNLPANSVIILQGNKNIEKDYEQWLTEHNERRLFDVQYSNHFGHIFFDGNLPMTPAILEAINNPDSHDYNSLNRIYRPQRGAHLYFLARNNLLDRGLVSGNQVDFNDPYAAQILKCTQTEWAELMAEHYPRFLDGDWSNTNAANQYNDSIYKNSLMTVITETKYSEPVTFLTEKIFKPIALGHPLILLSAPGTLRALSELGFRIDWCGIDPSYNDIVDDTERFYETHKILKQWINYPREQKVELIQRSMATINHNFHLIRMKDFYKDALETLIERSGEHFKNVRF